MRILGIETATEVCGVAIVEGETMVETVLEEKNIHSEKLLPLVHEVLKSSASSLKSFQGIAVSIGPGSFTGLRIGLSVAKGLAFALEVPIVGVPTLTALARRLVNGSVNDGECVVAALDARRDDIYCQAFRYEGGKLLPLTTVRSMSVGDAIEEWRDEKVVLTGNAAEKFSSLLMKRKATRWRTPSGDLTRCSAASVALCGAEIVARGPVEANPTLEPHYGREFSFRKKEERTHGVV